MKRTVISAILLTMIIIIMQYAAAKSELSLNAPKSVQPYQNAKISVTLPVSGFFQLYLEDCNNEEFIITEYTTGAGEIEVTWKGLYHGDMPLPKGKYTLTAGLTGDDGNVYGESIAFEVSKAPVSVLQFALPSSNILNVKAAQ